MPGKDLPIDTGSMVQGMGYFSMPAPTDDAADTSSVGSSKVPESIGPTEPPLQPVDCRTVTEDAPGLGARQVTSLHQDGWLDYDKSHMGTPET